MPLNQLLDELGYTRSPFYREGVEGADPSVAHLLRDARRTGVRGTYFVRSVAGEGGVRRERPAVYVAEANTPGKARDTHRRLWNQGTTPFLLVSMPDQVRVYSGFAYDNDDERVGRVERPLDLSLGLGQITQQLAFLRADSVDSGEIWRAKGRYLTRDRRVDRALLRTLQALSRSLVYGHHLSREVAHALIGRFVYLYYLRERRVLSDEWLNSAGVDPHSVFSANASLEGFRRLTDAVDDRFNGHIFPITWSSLGAPSAEAVSCVARAFAGEEPATGQMALFSPFDFSFIPIELLSMMYEQFLHDEGEGKEEGAFYTCEPLADYLLAEVDTVKPLRLGKTVLDPCCGSGIFLVLAYRRLIEEALSGQPGPWLPPERLAEILTSSVFGVERKPEACLVTEFNLILTMLSYVHPPELDAHPDFRFPVLHRHQVFDCDFFDKDSTFWRMQPRFDWVVGNVPWIELDPTKPKEKFVLRWIQEANQRGDMPVARYRTCEAFTWRVRDCLADGGVAGLITHATSLTNDQSGDYRRAFFSKNQVHRITNFSNLAYVLFDSAEEPAATVVFSPATPDSPRSQIVHYGPLVVNQTAVAPDHSHRRRVPWVLTMCESEVQVVSAEEAIEGKGTTWKRALWGSPRDRRALERLRRLLPTSLGALAERRGWHLNLGLQLRPNAGTQEDRNLRESFLKHMKVLAPVQLDRPMRRLTLPEHWLVNNRWGSYVRERGGKQGLAITHAPHLFLWNDFAAFSEKDFIFRHPKLGLSAPPEDVDWLRAISAIWTSSVTPYCLFLDLSAAWGVGRSAIDLGDARRMPMPELTEELVRRLAGLHRDLAADELRHPDRADWQRRLDEGVAGILRLPDQIMVFARELTQFRLKLIKGKAPPEMTAPADLQQLGAYARRLTAELDGFMERKQRRHKVSVLRGAAGAVATVELLPMGRTATPLARQATPDDEGDIKAILDAAQKQYGQWVYVRRSVRVFAGDKIHVCKPARRLEWSETQALLDAADIIAEVGESRSQG